MLMASGLTNGWGHFPRRGLGEGLSEIRFEGRSTYSSQVLPYMADILASNRHCASIRVISKSACSLVRTAVSVLAGSSPAPALRPNPQRPATSVARGEHIQRLMIYPVSAMALQQLRLQKLSRGWAARTECMPTGGTVNQQCQPYHMPAPLSR